MGIGKEQTAVPVELISAPQGQVSGLSRYAATLTHYLEQLDDTPLALTFQTTTMPAYLSPIAWAGQAAGFDVRTFWQNYPGRIQTDKKRLYHFSSENLASALAFQRVTPAVVTVHGLFGYLLRNFDELQMYNHPIESWVDRQAVRGLYYADHLMCVSGYLYDVVVNRLGVAPERVSVVHEAVDHETFYPAEVAPAFYEKYGLQMDQPYLLYVGSEQPRKNFLCLLQSLARVRAQGVDIHLLKVGRPEYALEREKAERLIAELGLGDAVHFVGHAVDDLPDFYRLATAFVFPSMYEGFGFPPLEAQACGTAVICSNTTSLPEVVGKGAYLIDPYDEDDLVAGLMAVLTNAGLRADLEARGLANAVQFRWERTARETAAVYQDVWAKWQYRLQNK